MKKIPQLILILSCIFLLSLQSLNAFGKINAWGIEQALVDNNNDFDNQDVDGTIPLTHLFLIIIHLEEKIVTSNISKEKINLTFGFIRAPPFKNHFTS